MAYLKTPQANTAMLFYGCVPSSDLPESVLITYSYSRIIQGVVVIYPHVHYDRPGIIVDNSCNHLVKEHCNSCHNEHHPQ